MDNRCDAEIGSTKNGWHACRRKATIRVFRYTGERLGGYSLEYCGKHARLADDKPKSILFQTVYALPPAPEVRDE
jgi:hypothetical protein